MLAQDTKNKGMVSSEYIEKFSENPEFIKFINEVQSYLGIAYTFDEDIFENVITSKTNEIVSIYNFHYKTSSYSGNYTDSLDFYTSKSLNDDEIYMNISKYNSLFNTHYNETTAKTFEPHKIEILIYDTNKTSGEIVYEKEFLGKE